MLDIFYIWLYITKLIYNDLILKDVLFSKNFHLFNKKYYFANARYNNIEYFF